MSFGSQKGSQEALIALKIIEKRHSEDALNKVLKSKDFGYPATLWIELSLEREPWRRFFGLVLKTNENCPKLNPE